MGIFEASSEGRWQERFTTITEELKEIEKGFKQFDLQLSLPSKLNLEIDEVLKGERLKVNTSIIIEDIQEEDEYDNENEQDLSAEFNIEYDDEIDK